MPQFFVEGSSDSSPVPPEPPPLTVDPATYEELLPPPETWWTDLFVGQPDWLHLVLGAVLILVAALIGAWITRGLITPLLHSFVSRTRNAWDDILFDRRFLYRAAWLGGTLVLFYGPVVLWGDPDRLPTVGLMLRTAANAVMIICIAAALVALLSAINAIYARREIAKTRPIKGYLQIAAIIIYIAAAILTIATLLDRSPLVLLTGLGALTAVLMLVFKDTILSLVASIQLASNDMLRVGDWLEMPSESADGDVIDIALHTVKVQNWDKTITTIPTWKLISSSYKNWRGMKDAGGRRIKRSLAIDMNTVHFLDEEEIELFSRFELLTDYMAEKRRILAEQGAEDDGELIRNRRRLTNIGTFRAWVIAYLRANPNIHQEGLTFLVRQLPPSEHGIPIEVYVFSKSTVWAEYEAIQADIFDHLLAMLPQFGLRPYQAPSGADLARLDPGDRVAAAAS